MATTDAHVITPTTPVRLLRLRDVVRHTGLCRSLIYRLTADGRFPAAVRLHGRAVAWRSDEVDAWIASRPRAGRTPETTTPPVEAGGVSAHLAG